jgi:putative ABC transport system substrate-binding protein
VRRRDFLSLISSGAVAWPLAVHAQHADQIRRIGMLIPYAEGDRQGQAFIAAFREGLQKLGWTEGRNIHLTIGWARPDDPKLRQRFAKEIIALNPVLIISHGTPNTAALAEQTRTIPIIFVNVTDPIKGGFVASFPRPGGNITGFTNYEPTLASKWLELLNEVAPRVTRVAFLFNPTTAPYFEYYLTPFKSAARSLGMEAIVAPVHDASELEPIIAVQAREPKGGMILIPDTFTSAHRVEIVTLAARYRIAAIYPLPFFATQGGLLSYGVNTREQYRRAAGYADRVLKGKKPGELPVQLPVGYELIVNLKTAKALGLTMPRSVIIRADKLIE